MLKLHALHANNLAKELQIYVEYALIPGDLMPAIVWLASRTTVELEMLAELYNVDYSFPTRRVLLMKGILQGYYGTPN